MTVKRRSRAGRVSSIVTVVLMMGAVGLACADERFGIGEDCIKDSDCLSNICNDLKCTAAPPILDRDATTTAHDASADVTTDASDSGADSASDSATDSAGDSAIDSGTD